MTGRGIALGGFANSQVGVVADITVNKKTGKIRVDHLYAAQVNGLTISPGLVENQMSGNLIQGLSRGSARAGHVRQEPRHEPRLGHLPDPPLRGLAASHDGLDPAEGPALDRLGRAGQRTGGGGGRKRVLRRDRSTHPSGADEPGPGARNAEGCCRDRLEQLEQTTTDELRGPSTGPSELMLPQVHRADKALGFVLSARAQRPAPDGPKDANAVRRSRLRGTARRRPGTSSSRRRLSSSAPHRSTNDHRCRT